jgi:hypothetical protein
MFKPIKIVLVSAREDEALREQLKRHLQSLQRQGFIRLWDDSYIRAGLEYESEHDANLKTAQVILLLVSPDFISFSFLLNLNQRKSNVFCF